MKISRNALVLIIAIPLVVLSMGSAVYFFWDSLRAQHEANDKILKKFGFEIMPVSPYTESTGMLGHKQLPATFAEEDLSPVEKVIQGLLKDREKLLEENEALEKQVEELQQEVAQLEEYKSLNQRFAPESLQQELATTRGRLRQLLHDLPESRHYSDYWIDLMADAALVEYRRFIENNRLMVDEATLEELISKDLVTYGFCIGNAVELAANSPEELRTIARWLNNPQTTRLSSALEADLEVVLPPCRVPLRQKLNALLQGNIAG